MYNNYSEVSWSEGSSRWLWVLQHGQLWAGLCHGSQRAPNGHQLPEQGLGVFHGHQHFPQCSDMHSSLGVIHCPMEVFQPVHCTHKCTSTWNFIALPFSSWSCLLSAAVLILLSHRARRQLHLWFDHQGGGNPIAPCSGYSHWRKFCAAKVLCLS